MKRLMDLFFVKRVEASGDFQAEAEAELELGNGETLVMAGTLRFTVVKALPPVQEKDISITLEEGQSVEFDLSALNSAEQELILEAVEELNQAGAEGSWQVSPPSGLIKYTAPAAIPAELNFQKAYSLKHKDRGLPKVEVK